MPELKDIRASLEVGFAEGGLPEKFLKFRGRQTRALGDVAQFPYEDSQFDVVLMAGSSVSHESVKEAHRVLRPEGRLFFSVPEKTKKQAGYTLPDIYSIVREGFNIVEFDRPPWWRFGGGERQLTVTAQKKNWKSLQNSFRPYV